VINNWIKAKKILDEMSFPEVDNPPKPIYGERHGGGKVWHTMDAYRFYIEPILGFDVMAKYNFCSLCKKNRNKHLIMFDNQNGLFYGKRFVFHGEAVIND